MKSNFDLVHDFHEAFGQPVRTKPQNIPFKETTLRRALITEELQELREAHDAGDIVGIADALADLLYVVYGTAVVHGIDIDQVFYEVHRSNMSKLGLDGKPVMRADGKVLKGPTYSPPDIAGVLRRGA
jgi:predicted HAD superfamily Cof-like phosphohydrolase